MKLSAKKQQSSDKRLQGIETAKKTGSKSSRPKKAEIVKKTGVVKKTDTVKKANGAKKAVKKSGERSMAWVDTVRDYLREVMVELKKVIWPSRKETLGTTGVVLVIVALTAVFLGIMDLLLSRLMRLLVG